MKHHDLEVWRQSVLFTVLVYGITDCFPARERYGLARQIRNSAISIPSNVAEGASRTSPREFRGFISNALASVSELETLLEVAKRLGFIDDDPALLLVPLCRIRMMLIKLRQALDKKHSRDQAVSTHSWLAPHKNPYLCSIKTTP